MPMKCLLEINVKQFNEVKVSLINDDSILVVYLPTYVMNLLVSYKHLSQVRWKNHQFKMFKWQLYIFQRMPCIHWLIKTPIACEFLRLSSLILLMQYKLCTSACDKYFFILNQLLWMWILLELNRLCQKALFFIWDFSHANSNV